MKSDLKYHILRFILPTALLFFLADSFKITAQEYIFPPGLPEPEFGINETVASIYGDSYYTHYIDVNHQNATDENNPFGSSDLPRKSIPNSLAEGSVVLVIGGPYEIQLSNLNGTKSNPIFIRGLDDNNRFKITSILGGNYNLINSSYLIIEHAHFENAQIQIGQNTHHIAIRYSDIDGKDSNTGISLWTNRNTYQVGELKNHILLFKNIIHDCGIYPADDETGRFGIMIDNASEYVWILDNHIYENGDDGIQIIDRNWIPEIANVEAKHIYIAKNLMHHDGENAIDVKGSEDVIILQNEIYGYETIFNSSRGEAIRINDEGSQNNIWIINNHIYDSEQAINPLQSLFRPYIIGNLIHDCKDYAINIDAGWVINNTIFNATTAIADAENGAINNLIVSSSENSIINGEFVQNNIIWNAPAPQVDCVNCIYEDPLFEDLINQNFKLSNSSPAIDAGFYNEVIEQVYTHYLERYGKDILFDLNNVQRPINGYWDIGAHEYEGLVDVIESDSKEVINLFPNPASHLVQIKGLYNYDKILLRNSNGQLIKKIKFANEELYLDISNLASGLYYLDIISTTTSNRITKNIVVD